MAKISIDFAKPVGPMRPVHGVNAGPRTRQFKYDAVDLFRKAGIPYCRLHDVEYPFGCGEFVDMHCIFRNFDADEEDPASYNFFLTDHYIGACYEAGAEVVYRLGESAQNSPLKIYSAPPKDFAKWARICEHIVRHYNEGWADGYHWNVRYWEIWNEPDLGTDAMWTGTQEEYRDLYEITARHLKACFPDIMIGGPANAGNTGKAVEFIRDIAKREAPLDFLSFHKYTCRIEVFRSMFEIIEKELRENGFSRTEIHLNEWNYMEDWGKPAASVRRIPTDRGAAFCAAALVTFQKMGLDVGNYFSAEASSEFCGLFEKTDRNPRRCHADVPVGGMGPMQQLRARKPYYAFLGFGDLYRMGTETESVSSVPHVYALAASDGKRYGAMLATYQYEIWEGRFPEQAVCEESEVKLSGLPSGGSVIRVFLTDEGHNGECIRKIPCTEETASVSLPLHDDQIYYIEAARP